MAWLYQYWTEPDGSLDWDVYTRMEITEREIGTMGILGWRQGDVIDWNGRLAEVCSIEAGEPGGRRIIELILRPKEGGAYYA